MAVSVVVSTLLAAVGYCPSSGLLVVRFRSGGMYGYFDVPFEVAQGLLGNESKGPILQSVDSGSVPPRFPRPGGRRSRGASGRMARCSGTSARNEHLRLGRLTMCRRRLKRGLVTYSQLSFA